MLKIARASKPIPPPVAVSEPELEVQFIARFPLDEGVFEGTLLELAAQLRAGKLRPVQVLSTSVLAMA